MKILYKTASLCVFQSALFQTNSAVINTEDAVIVVDPNWLPDEIAAIKKHVAKCGDKPLFLLFTHSDYDHIIGYGAFPEAVGVIASRAFVENADKEKNLEQIRTFDDDYYIVRDYVTIYPVVTHVIEHDGQKINIGNTELIFYLAAGHNPDGVFAVVNDVWIVGDYLCAVEFPYIYHSSIEYEKTLAKADFILRHHKINTLVCGHGDILTPKNTGKIFIDEVLKRKTVALDYIHHVRAAIENPKHAFDFEAYVKDYDFPRIMKRFHDKNVDLIKRELF